MDSRYDNEITLAVVIGSIVFFILVAFSISYFVTYKRKRKEHRVEMKEFKKQFEQQLLQSQIEVQEQTFQQIGKELHDNVGQLLSTARMLLGLTERSLNKPPDTLLTANETLAEAISQLRSLSKSLDKEWLEQFNFAENLRSEIARINSSNKVQATYDQPGKIRLKPAKQIILFRIVQEAIQNAIKHANPSVILVKVAIDQEKYIIEVIDNGSSLDMNTHAGGMGIINMKHRTTLLGGVIAWNTVAGKGTTVTISLPLKEEQA